MQGKIIILGKPNVGKSSLFNRLLKDKIAITSDIEGTTRDINIRPLVLGEGENALNIELCDSAGLVKKASGIFKNVKKMIFDFINDGDLILYVVSAGNALDDEDLRLFRSLKNAILVVNKIDIEKNERWEYNAFGAEKIFYVSSLHNRGIKQLRDFLTLWVGNSSLGASYPLGGNFGEQQTQKSSFIPKISSKYKTSTAIRRICEQSEAINTRICEKIAESKLDSAESQNLVKNNPREAQPLASSGQVLNGGKGVVAEGEGSDFAIRKNPCIQAPAPSLKKNARSEKGESKADLSAQRRGEIDSTDFYKMDCHADSANLLAMTENNNCAESSADSAPSTQEVNSAIADEFLGFCKVSDEDRTLVHRGSEPKQSLKSRCESEFTTINIGIIGRVNVGKSSILNALLNKERSLVSEIEGTTIDPVSDEIIYKDKILRFVDTAGIRRASKIEGIEKFALTRTKRILEQSNIVLLVLDSSRDFVELDEKISGLSQKYNLGIIILLNKWDIKCADFRAFSESIKRKFAYLSYAPILTISALKMRHIDEIKECILRVWENFNRRIPTALLNSHIKIATQRHPLPSDRGKIVKIYYASQVDCAPPQILLVMNRPRALHFSYKRYLVNYFRANFDFSGVPIVILSKGRGKDEVAE